MKGVTDIFISKQKLAIFWFLVAVSCVVGTAWHLYGVALEGRRSMLYVPIDLADVYIDNGLTKETLDSVVDFQTRLIMETYLNRGPKGPLNLERMGMLFSETGYDQSLEDIKANSYDFDKRKVHQMVEIGEVSLLHKPDGGAASRATGQVIRVSIDPVANQAITQSFALTANLEWDRNENLRDKKRFVYLCKELQYSLREMSSSEK